MVNIISAVLSSTMIILFLASFAIVIYALIDCIRTDESQINNIPKWLWALIIIVVDIGIPVGAILWFTIGKQKVAKPKKRKVTGPDDDPDFLKGL